MWASVGLRANILLITRAQSWNHVRYDLFFDQDNIIDIILICRNEGFSALQ